jgi:hypothetical protein
MSYVEPAVLGDHTAQREITAPDPEHTGHGENRDGSAAAVPSSTTVSPRKWPKGTYAHADDGSQL